MDEDSSISIVLTPVQLAAILQGESVNSEATLSNRLWGGLKLAGGVAEMIGGAALCAVPEPTGATKVGCVVLGGHGVDTASTGLREVWTGQEIRSLTERGLAELATRLGAGAHSGKALGMSVELAVPIGFAGAIKAARVTSIAAGRLSLSRHEATVHGGIGGHAIAKHVGKTRDYLEARLRNEPKLQAASTFNSIQNAEQAINGVMRSRAEDILIWAKTAPKNDVLRLTATTADDVGVVLIRGASELVKGRKLIVLLKKERYNGMQYYLLTAYLGA